MAILFKASSSPFVLGLILLSCSLVTCTEFQVGGKDGWVVPKQHDQFYNDWASKNRFVVHDTVRFKYEKDSVMVVSEEEYEKCRSLHPIFFSNNGDTVFMFDRPGSFFFISGVSGHCDRGQKMIIKVLKKEEAPSPQSEDQNAEQNNKGGAAQITPIAKTTSALIVLSLLCLLLP